MELLEQIPDVKQVKKLSYGGDRLELEVFYSATHDVAHLESAIVDSSVKSKRLETLDVTYSRGRELNFKL